MATPFNVRYRLMVFNAFNYVAVHCHFLNNCLRFPTSACAQLCNKDDTKVNINEIFYMQMIYATSCDEDRTHTEATQAGKSQNSTQTTEMFLFFSSFTW